jgi:hypothetical protein
MPAGRWTPGRGHAGGRLSASAAPRLGGFEDSRSVAVWRTTGGRPSGLGASGTRARVVAWSAVGTRSRRRYTAHGGRAAPRTNARESGTRVVRDLGFRESLTPCWASLLGWAPGPFCQRLVGRLASGSRARPS